MSLKLNLGCGGQLAEGWVNIDRAFPPLTEGMRENTLEHDFRFPLPQGDGTVEMAVAHHVLDLLPPRELKHLLGEVARVLQEGGVLRVSSVNYRSGVVAAVARDLEWFRRHGVPAAHLEDPLEAFSWWFDCGGARQSILATEMIAAAWLEEAGLEVRHVGFHETCFRLASICDLDSREEESFYLEGRKS